MGLCVEEVPIFIDTNLDTHIAMAVSPEFTVGDLKRKLVKEHSICFPEIGQIGIDGVMVKRKSCFYYLPDSMPVNNAFQRLKGVWFLRMSVTPLVCSIRHCPSKGLVTEPRDSAFCSSNISDCQNLEDSTNLPSTSDKNDKVKRKTREVSPTLEDIMEELLLPVNVPKKKKKKTCSHFHEKVLDGASGEEALLDPIKETHDISSQGRLHQCNALKSRDRKREPSSQPNINASSPNTSDIVSVTGILTRYFPDFDEVKSYAGSSSDKIINCIENETYQADQDETLKSNAGGNCSVVLDQRELPIRENDAPPKMPCNVLPTNTYTRAARTKLGKSKTGKPMPSKTALPDSPKLKTLKGCKPERSKARKHLPPKVPSIVKPSPYTLRYRIETSCEVGKRLLQAANDLGISTSKRKPTVSSCKSKGVKFSSTLVRKLEFDFIDTDQ